MLARHGLSAASSRHFRKLAIVSIESRGWMTLPSQLLLTFGELQPSVTILLRFSSVALWQVLGALHAFM